MHALLHSMFQLQDLDGGVEYVGMPAQTGWEQNIAANLA
jgi:hypothetical protein